MLPSPVQPYIVVIIGLLFLNGRLREASISEKNCSMRVVAASSGKR